MLFDLIDYYLGGVLGTDCNGFTASSVNLSDVCVTAAATREASFKSVREWYKASNFNIDGDCVHPASVAYDEWLAAADAYGASFGIFQDKILNDPSSVTGESLSIHMTELSDLMFKLKVLFSIVDGEKFTDTTL